MVKTISTPLYTEITLTPNRSLEWKQIKTWLVILSLPTVFVATGWLVAGVWIILPFAGLELLLLSYLMYRVCYQNYRIQQIKIEKDKITVVAGIYQSTQIQQFNRQDCYLAVTQPTKPIENLELELKSESQSLSIGEFLNPEDRECARQSIRNAGLIECSSRWWGNHH